MKEQYEKHLNLLLQEIEGEISVLAIIPIGSQLHGLATKESDTDYLVLTNESLHKSLSEKASMKNVKIVSSHDVEFKVTSIYHFISMALSGTSLELLEVLLFTENFSDYVFEELVAEVLKKLHLSAYELLKTESFSQIVTQSIVSEVNEKYKVLTNVSGKVNMEKIKKEKMLTLMSRRFWQLGYLRHLKLGISQPVEEFSTPSKEMIESLLAIKTSKIPLEQIQAGAVSLFDFTKRMEEKMMNPSCHEEEYISQREAIILQAIISLMKF